MSKWRIISNGVKYRVQSKSWYWPFWCGIIAQSLIDPWGGEPQFDSKDEAEQVMKMLQEREKTASKKWTKL